MSNNHDDEVLNNRSNAEPENLSEEIIPSEGTTTTSSNQKKENMEVHHHPDLHHHPKKWKEYFLEFLMIFLAVTMGFLAENLREHIKDRSEIQLDMQSMVADLLSDVYMYNSTLSSNQNSNIKTDSLITLLKMNRANTSEIYFLARFITANNQNYSPSTKTFEQMKSSGSLRLIEPRTLLDSISDYYQSVQYFKEFNTLQDQKITDVHLANGQLFDGYTFQKILRFVPTKTGFVRGEITKPEGNPPLLSDNFIVINSVITAYHYLYAITEANNTAAMDRTGKAKRLINLLKSEFNLK